MPDPKSDFRPSAPLAVLHKRAEMLQRTRQFFAERSFLEVETPLLSHDVVVDRHLDPFVTTLAFDPRRPDDGAPLYLQTSPEFGMKRLLAAGATAIYQITRAFRNGEAGRLHNPEFTMVEWYRVGDGLLAGIRLLSELSEVLLNRGQAEQIGYGDAFLAHVGCNPHLATIAELQILATEHGVAAPESLATEDRDGWLELLFGELVEPRLGVGHPSIVYDYPAGQAALARVRNETTPVAERFELYVDGLELANGYHELLDAQVLRERNRANNLWRAADGKRTLPEESRLLAAMEHGLPTCAGVALGFDRCVMLAVGAQSIREVLPFPVDLA